MSRNGYVPISLSFAPLAAAAEQAVQRFDLPAGALADQLNQLAAQSGVYLAGNAALTTGKTGPALHGSYSVDQALHEAMLASAADVAKRGLTADSRWGDIQVSGQTPIHGGLK